MPKPELNQEYSLLRDNIPQFNYQLNIFRNIQNTYCHLSILKQWLIVEIFNFRELTLPKNTLIFPNFGIYLFILEGVKQITIPISYL